MPEIDLQEVGVHISGSVARFGLYLPGIRQSDGFDVKVRIIHRADQFVPEIPSVPQSLDFNVGHPLDLWGLTLDLASVPNPPGHFGADGQYLYRFELWRNGNLVAKVFADPFGFTAGPGLLSAFTVGPILPFDWGAPEADYRTPPLDELIVYELGIPEFNGDFDGVVERLDYLEGLGVNCLEVMPVTAVKREFDWGYGPIGYFAPEESLGGNDGMKRLVKAAHERGIAVILDVVYGHADGTAFPYAVIYDKAGIPNPMMQEPNRDAYGRGFEHTKEMTRQFCLAANKHWLDTYHVDGFRYDNVPGFYDGNPLEKYGTLVFNTYIHSRTIGRFQDAGNFSRIIQCAEDLDDPRGILRQTFTNCTWQDALLHKAERIAQGGSHVDEELVHLLDPSFGGDPYPEIHDAAPAGDKPFPVAPFQYLNSHDNSWLITNFGLESGRPSQANEIGFGNRENYYKLQPYAIALLASKGIPMLLQGEEFAENYKIAGDGPTRVNALLHVHWEYFYDENGNPLIRVYRRMGKLRRALPALRSHDFFYYNVESRPIDGVIAFRRRAAGQGGEPDQIALVVLNFSDSIRTIHLSAPVAGTYREMLDRLNRPAGIELEKVAVQLGDNLTITVPPNYGHVFVTPPPPAI